MIHVHTVCELWDAGRTRVAAIGAEGHDLLDDVLVDGFEGALLVEEEVLEAALRAEVGRREVREREELGFVDVGVQRRVDLVHAAALVGDRHPVALAAVAAGADFDEAGRLARLDLDLHVRRSVREVERVQDRFGVRRERLDLGLPPRHESHAVAHEARA